MENRYFRVGNVLSPLSGSVSGSSVLADADPVLQKMIDYFPAVIRTHCEARWNEEAIACGLGSTLSGNMIAQIIPYDPLPLAGEVAWRFPLLAVYPTESEFIDLTQTWYEIKRNFTVLFLMPPLSAEQGERLYPFRSHVERVLLDRISESTDEVNTPGASVWSQCGVKHVKSLRSSHSKLPSIYGGKPTDMYFPFLAYDIEVSERRNPVPENFVYLDGVSTGSIDLGSSDDDNTAAVVDFITVTIDT